jgi:hypothetical protein
MNGKLKILMTSGVLLVPFLFYAPSASVVYVKAVSLTYSELDDGFTVIRFESMNKTKLPETLILEATDPPSNEVSTNGSEVTKRHNDYIEENFVPVS